MHFCTQVVISPKLLLPMSWKQQQRANQSYTTTDVLAAVNSPILNHHHGEDIGGGVGLVRGRSAIHNPKPQTKN